MHVWFLNGRHVCNHALQTMLKRVGLWFPIENQLFLYVPIWMYGWLFKWITNSLDMVGKSYTAFNRPKSALWLQSCFNHIQVNVFLRHILDAQWLYASRSNINRGRCMPNHLVFVTNICLYTNIGTMNEMVISLPHKWPALLLPQCQTLFSFFQSVFNTIFKYAFIWSFQTLGIIWIK